MKSRIEKIKEKATQINLEQLMKMGKNVFYKDHFEEFDDSIGPQYILDEIYTAYTSENRLVLECLMKYCDTHSPDELDIPEEDFTKSRDIIYIKGNEVKELRTEKMKTDEDNMLYREILDTIETANAISRMQKQHIRNFFRRIFVKKNNLLDGSSIKLTKEDITDMLQSVIKGKDENFMNKYNTEKTDQDRIVDSMEEKKDKLDRSQEDNIQEL